MRTVYPLPAEEADLDAVYAYPPGGAVRVNMIASVDGAAELDGGSRALGSPADRQLIGHLRALADVVLVGAGTARAEGYGPLRPRRARREARLAAGLAPVPRLAIVSGSLALDFDAPAFTEAELPTVVVTHAAAPEDRLAAAAKAADVVVAGEHAVDAAAAVDALGARGLTRVLCEGGPTLLGALAAADCVDDFCLTVSPMLVAGDATRAVAGPDLAPPMPLALAHVLEEDGYLYVHYTRRRD